MGSAWAVEWTVAAYPPARWGRERESPATLPSPVALSLAGSGAGRLLDMQVQITPETFSALMERLYERGDRLELRREGETYPRSEDVNAYVLSAHAEALLSDEIDGDVWGTLEDLDETANTEEEAWAKIRAFYLSRGHALIRVGEAEEWIFDESLARRLGLLES